MICLDTASARSVLEVILGFRTTACVARNIQGIMLMLWTTVYCVSRGITMPEAMAVHAPNSEVGRVHPRYRSHRYMPTPNHAKVTIKETLYARTGFGRNLNSSIFGINRAPTGPSANSGNPIPIRGSQSGNLLDCRDCQSMNFDWKL